MKSTIDRGLSWCVALMPALLLILPEAAAAQNVDATLRRWGLLGTWALDCAQVQATIAPQSAKISRPMLISLS